MKIEFMKDFGRFHGDDYASAVVDRACAQVPRIEVPGDDDHLFGMLGPF